MNATEHEERTTAEPSEATEEAPRCRWGRSTPEPCPRPATAAAFGEDVPTMCAEHGAAYRFTELETEWWYAEERIKKLLMKARRRSPKSPLVELLEETLERARRGKEDNYKKIEAAHAVAGSYKGEE